MQIEVPRRRSTAIPLTPLIDVVFILLVFFMLASSFKDWRGFDLALPAADRAADTATRPVVVMVSADGDFRVGGQRVAPDVLAARVRALRQGDSDRPIVVRIADGAPVQATITALDRLHAGGFKAATLTGVAE